MVEGAMATFIHSRGKEGTMRKTRKQLQLVILSLCRPPSLPLHPQDTLFYTYVYIPLHPVCVQMHLIGEELTRR